MDSGTSVASNGRIKESRTHARFLGSQQMNISIGYQGNTGLSDIGCHPGRLEHCLVQRSKIQVTGSPKAFRACVCVCMFVCVCVCVYVLPTHPLAGRSEIKLLPKVRTAVRYPFCFTIWKEHSVHQGDAIKYSSNICTILCKIQSLFLLGGISQMTTDTRSSRCGTSVSVLHAEDAAVSVVWI